MLSYVAIPGAAWVMALTVDHLGNLWYAAVDPTNAFGATIGRRDAAGHITTYPLSDPCEFGGIAEGPDGAIWFTEDNMDTIGRLAPDGTITTDSAPSPWTMVVGADGNMWFASGTNGNAVGRLRIS
jgi:virginiamycin B lyase